MYFFRKSDPHEDSVCACTFSPDGIYAVTGSLAGDLRLWDVRWGHSSPLAVATETHDLGVTAAQFRPVTDMESKLSTPHHLN